jgi:membrane protease YdiL (CAAX protease family)
MNNPYIRVITVSALNVAFLFIMFASGVHRFIESPNTYVFALATIAGSLLTIAATWIFYRAVDKKALSTMRFGLNRKQLQFVLLSSMVTLAFFVGATVFMSNHGFIDAPLNRHYFSNLNVIPMQLISAFAWLLVGFNEEILYRGYMVANMKHFSVKKMFLFSSLFFAISHIFVDGPNPIMLVVLLSAAVTLMYVYLKTGSLTTVIIPHFLYDFCTRQLFSTGEISIFQFKEAPSDLYSAVLHFSFLLIQITLVMLIFKRKVKEGLEEFNS